MSSLSPCRLLAVGLAIGLLAGCAHGRRPTPAPDDGAPSAGAPSSGTGLTAEDIRGNPGQPIEKILMGRVPGLWAERTADGGIALRIRGTSTITGSTAPLYVVDGVPLDAGPNGALAGINPDDIESVQVLKDAASMTMYGSRGANGVIVVKTKRAKVPGRPE